MPAKMKPKNHIGYAEQIGSGGYGACGGRTQQFASTILESARR